jgi:hypothetical protein
MTQVIAFLKEYSLITINSKAEKIKLDENFQKLLTQNVK